MQLTDDTTIRNEKHNDNTEQAVLTIESFIFGQILGKTKGYQNVFAVACEIDKIQLTSALRALRYCEEKDLRVLYREAAKEIAKALGYDVAQTNKAVEDKATTLGYNENNKAKMFVVAALKMLRAEEYKKRSR